MDLVDIIETKKFLGQEFLTWLLFLSWVQNGVVGADSDDHSDIMLTFVGQTILEDSEGNEKVTCKNVVNNCLDVPEVMTALRFGKKVQQAKVTLNTKGVEFTFTITADLLEFKAVKLPAIAQLPEFTKDEQECEGYILETVYLVELLRSTVRQLLIEFILLRVSDSWPEEKKRISAWIESSAN
jgi:recombination associated protein RdgC